MVHWCVSVSFHSISGSTYGMHRLYFTFTRADATKNWTNLLAWMKAWHEQPEVMKLYRRQSAKLPLGRTKRAVIAVGEIVQEMRNDPWDRVARVLESFHDVLRAQDSRWA